MRPVRRKFKSRSAATRWSSIMSSGRGAGYETARVEIGAVRENLAIDLKPGGLTRGFKVIRARDREHRARSGEIARTARAIASGDCAVIRRQVAESPVCFT